ncbi:MAG: hypothetical protein F6K17_25160 [Okeania sp. SIO3C4]|nr:hypothetical protein [Okeania sp. SIO3B3]NER05640.1 hypothetical protein [Okeania sp. SIO3C4]
MFHRVQRFWLKGRRQKAEGRRQKVEDRSFVVYLCENRYKKEEREKGGGKK